MFSFLNEIVHELIWRHASKGCGTVWVACPDRVLGCLSFAALSAAVRVRRVGQYEFSSEEVMSVMSFCSENDDPISSGFLCLNIINWKCNFSSVR